MEKKCISCGMPMRRSGDYPLGDTSREYCVHCAREDGSMKTYDEVLEGMTRFLVTTQGFDETVARETAREMLSRMPAWRTHTG